MLLSRCAVYGSKKDPKLSIGKKPLIVNLIKNQKFFEQNTIIWRDFFKCTTINNIINKFLLAGDMFIPKMHLKQPEFTYSAFGPITKNKTRMQKYKKTGYSRYVK